MDLSPALQKQIAQLGARYGATKIVLFGSRARGDNHPRSDIDLAIYGMPERQQASFYFAVEEELQTLLKFDWYTLRSTPVLRCCKIFKRMVSPSMSKYKTKVENFCLAAQRLNEANLAFELEPDNELLP